MSIIVKKFRFQLVLISVLSIFFAIGEVNARRLNLNKLEKDAAPEVIKCIEDQKGLDPEYRSKCVDIIGRWKEASGKGAVHSVLSDRGEGGLDKNQKYVPSKDVNARVRVSACYALGEIRASDSVPVLIRTLKEDYSYEVRVAAAYVLQLYDSEASVDGLIDALLLEIQKDKNAAMPVVKQIIRSLGVVGHKKAFIPLLKATQVSFPDHIKEDAQKSIESIKWNKDFQGGK